MKKSTKIIIAIISFLLCVAIGIGGIIIFGNPQNSQEDVDYTIQPGDLLYGIRHLDNTWYDETFVIMDDVNATIEINNEKKAFVVFYNELGVKKETSFKKMIKEVEKLTRKIANSPEGNEMIEKAIQKYQEKDAWNKSFGKEDVSKIKKDPWFMISHITVVLSGLPIDEVYSYAQTERGKVHLVYWFLFGQEVGVADYKASPDSPLYGVQNASTEETFSYLADKINIEEVICNADGSVIVYYDGQYLYLSKEKLISVLSDIMVNAFKETDAYKNENVALEDIKALQKDYPNIVLPTKENANKLATDEWYWLSIMCGISSGVPVDEIYKYTQTDIGKYEVLVFVYLGQEFGNPQNLQNSNIPEIK